MAHTQLIMHWTSVLLNEEHKNIIYVCNLLECRKGLRNIFSDLTDRPCPGAACLTLPTKPLSAMFVLYHLLSKKGRTLAPMEPIIFSLLRIRD